MEEKQFEETYKKFVKWSRITTITSIIFVIAFGLISNLLVILKELSDFEEKAPFLYTPISAVIVIILFLITITFLIISYIKAHRYKKLIEESDKE